MGAARSLTTAGVIVVTKVTEMVNIRQTWSNERTLGTSINGFCEVALLILLISKSYTTTSAHCIGNKDFYHHIHQRERTPNKMYLP